MDGRKFDWIRQQLGLSKVELARQLGISRQSLYRCIWEGPPRVVALAILGLQAAAIRWESLSGDGAQHLLAGQHALLHGQNLHNLEHPPLVKLVAALPVLVSGEPLGPPVLPREALAATDRMHRQPERVRKAATAGRWAVFLAFGVPLLIACFFLGLVSRLPSYRANLLETSSLRSPLGITASMTISLASFSMSMSARYSSRSRCTSASRSGPSGTAWILL